MLVAVGGIRRQVQLEVRGVEIALEVQCDSTGLHVVGDRGGEREVLRGIDCAEGAVGDDRRRGIGGDDHEPSGHLLSEDQARVGGDRAQQGLAGRVGGVGAVLDAAVYRDIVGAVEVVVGGVHAETGVADDLDAAGGAVSHTSDEDLNEVGAELQV